MNCDNCGRHIWTNISLTCLCGKHFCSKRCSDEWHEGEKLEEEDEAQIH